MKTLLSSSERVRGCKRSAWEAWLLPSHHQISKIVSGLKKKKQQELCLPSGAVSSHGTKVSALRKKNKGVSSNTQNIQICTCCQSWSIQQQCPCKQNFPRPTLGQEQLYLAISGTEHIWQNTAIKDFLESSQTQMQKFSFCPGVFSSDPKQWCTSKILKAKLRLNNPTIIIMLWYITAILGCSPLTDL